MTEKTKNIIAKFRRDITCEEIDISVNKLLKNFNPEQEVEVSFDDDYKNIVVYIDTVHKPYLRVVK
ncbi:MAG: hypothetical protein L7S72_03715 [Flavobacteriales bacterium]|nr:hypothetical protein [Flavobacteriales bacterium]